MRVAFRDGLGWFEEARIRFGLFGNGSMNRATLRPGRLSNPGWCPREHSGMNVGEVRADAPWVRDGKGLGRGALPWFIDPPGPHLNSRERLSRLANVAGMPIGLCLADRD